MNFDLRLVPRVWLGVQRVGVCACFVLGAVVCGVTVVRTVLQGGWADGEGFLRLLIASILLPLFLLWLVFMVPALLWQHQVFLCS